MGEFKVCHVRRGSESCRFRQGNHDLRRHRPYRCSSFFCDSKLFGRISRSPQRSALAIWVWKLNNEMMVKKIFLGLVLFLTFTTTPVLAVTATGCTDTNGQIYSNGDVISVGGVNKECVISTTTGVAAWQTTTKQPTGATGVSYNQFMAGFSATACKNFAECSLPAYDLQQKQELDTSNTALNSYSYTWAQNNAQNLRILITGRIGDSAANGTNMGAINTMAMAIGGLYENKPASTVDYINNIAQNAGFSPVIKPAYAASGIGYSSLTPVLKLWQVIRNIAYLIFSVVFVVIGLMILFRVKIDPKTVISVQNALPKIIFSLILISFSYPLAGFLIDMMYVLIGVILSLANISGLVTDASKFGTNLQNESIFGFVGIGQWWGITTGAASAIQGVVNNLTGPLSLGGITGGVIGALGGLIIAVAILYALVKTWLALLGAYVNILIGVILSPLAMMVEAIPGQSGLGMWLRSMLSNLLAFPLVVALLVFGKAIMDYGTNNQGAMGSQAGFVPPLLGGNNPSSITALIGLGILLMIPKAVNILQDFLKAPPFKYGSAWSEATKWSWEKGPVGWGRGVAIDESTQRFGEYLRTQRNDMPFSQAIRNALSRNKRYTPQGP